MKFSEELWKSVDPIYQKILDLPFNRELLAGTLDKEKFKFYINQDSLYLLDYGKALSIVAGKARETDHVLQFIRFAEGAIEVERELHKAYFRKFNINVKEQKSPACFTYTYFLLAEAALNSFEEAVAALLPCFWIYMEVGNHIHQHAGKHNPYKDWIDTYAAGEFADATRQVIDITDQLAAEAGQSLKNRMKEAFIYSARLEYMFWDSAYKQEKWVP